jgi:DedD protein
MEQKKLLLVAISVGIFLVIVIGAAMLALGPGNSVSSAALAAASMPRPIPAGEAGTAGGFSAVTEPAYTPGTAPLPPADAAEAPGSPAAVSGPGLNAVPDGVPLQQNNFYINGSPEKPPVVESDESPRTIITVVPRTAAGVPDEPPAGRAASRPAAAAPTAPSAPAAARPVQAAASRPAQAKPAAAAAKAPETAKVYDNYWVQTGSFSAKARAEGVKEILASKGISSIIENREVDGKTFFRVRVGPYISQEEANYWLPRIQSIQGFENSQIWKTQSRR